jgi:tetratricopeptide (TPR) repeat protein
MDEENQGENQFVEFGRFLDSLRVRRGWTQEDAIAHLGVTRHTYIAWKTGQRLPSPKRLKHIAATFKLSQAEEDEFNRLSKLEPPKLHNFTFSWNPLFTGREKQLEKLGKLLKDNDSVALTQPVIIRGLPGIGKTQLALEYAHRCYPDVYRTVLWVDAANETTLVSSYDKLAHLLELPDLDERDLGRSVDAVKGWLERHTNWLLIMDNADNLQLARDFFPRAQQAKAYTGRILLTTRSQSVSDVTLQVIDIDKMEPAEGLLFLLLRAHKLEGDATPDALAADIRETATQVVELLDKHPLALDQAGAYIEDSPLVSFAEYIDLYHEKRSDLLRARASLDDENKGKYSYHPDTVVVTFKLCFEMAQKRHPLATDILRFCAFLHPDAIPEELFQYDDGFKFDAEAFKKGIRALLRYSLLKINSQTKTCSLHRLVQAVVIDDMSPDLQKQWRERVARALNAAFPEPDFKEWGWCERLRSHVFVCSACMEDQLAPTVGVAELFHKAGIYLSERGQFSEAEALLVRALSIYKQRFGVEHPNTVPALNSLAALYFYQGKYSQAESLYQQTLSIRERHLGAKHPDTGRSLSSLVLLYTYLGKEEQREIVERRVLSIEKKHGKKRLGAELPDTAQRIIVNRAVLQLKQAYYYEGKYEQAELLLVEELSRWEERLGAEHPETVRRLYNLAAHYHVQGKYEQAELLYRRAIRLWEKHLGAEHPNSQSSLIFGEG